MSNALHNTHNVMKCTKFLKLTAAILLVVVAGVGCQKKVQGPTPLGGYKQGTPTGEGPSGIIGDVPPGSTGIPISGDKSGWGIAADQPAALRDNTVYFDYD